MVSGNGRKQLGLGRQLAAVAIIVVTATACVQDGELDLPLERSVYETDVFVNLDVPGATADEVISQRTPRPMPFESHDPDLHVSRIWREVSEEAFLIALAQSDDTGAVWHEISCSENQISLGGTKELGGFLRLKMYYSPGDSTLHADFTTGAGGHPSDRPDIDEGCDIEIVEAAGFEPDLERFRARAALEADPVLAPLMSGGALTSPEVLTSRAGGSRVRILARWSDVEYRHFLERAATSIDEGSHYELVDCGDGTVDLSGVKPVEGAQATIELTYRSGKLSIALDLPVPAPDESQSLDQPEVDVTCGPEIVAAISAGA